MDHIDYLTSLVDLTGFSATDVGAGKGHFAKQLAANGAHVTGIEIEPGKVAFAQSRMPDSVRILEGRGEDLPIDSASQDLVCFMFSFHHIPAGVHDQALAEAARVLKPSGRLHVVEPLPENCGADPMRLIDDETLVRVQSHARIKALPGDGRFMLIDTRQYEITYLYDGFDTFVDSIVGVDPARAAQLPAVRDEMERMFNDAAIMDNGRYRFDEPCMAYHFQMD